MGKSLKRVKQALIDLGFGDCVVETGEATTAAQAAAELDCTVNQIAKSIIFKSASSGELVLFITAAARRVDMELATALVGGALERQMRLKFAVFLALPSVGLAPWAIYRRLKHFLCAIATMPNNICRCGHSISCFWQ